MKPEDQDLPILSFDAIDRFIRDLPGERDSHTTGSVDRTLRLAAAVVVSDVIQKGALLFNDGDPSVTDDLSGEDRSLVLGFARQAQTMVQQGLLRGPEAVTVLFREMSRPLRHLGALQRLLDDLWSDPSVVDPLDEMRGVADGLAEHLGKTALDVLPIFAQAEETFSRVVPMELQQSFATAGAPHRMAVLEQLAKDLTDALDAWVEEDLLEPWLNDGGEPITFPDGSPRYGTPFDRALAHGGYHYKAVQKGYGELLQTCINSLTAIQSIQLFTASHERNVGGWDHLEARVAARLAADRVSRLVMGTPLDPEVEAVLAKGAGTPLNLYLETVKQDFVFAPMRVAYHAGLNPHGFYHCLQVKESLASL